MSSNLNEWMKLRSGSDIRGKADQLTDEFAEKIGCVFAQWIARRYGTTPDKICLAVGHDSRLSGPRLEEALIRGMKAADCDVLDCGLCTTPAMFMTCVDPATRANGSIMITASHHPSDRNGFKFITRDGGLTSVDVKDLIEAAAKVTLHDPLVKQIDFLTIYTDSLKAMVRKRLNDDSAKPLLGLHVVVDAGNGAGGFYAKFLNDLGANIDGSQFLLPDGRFPNHIPNPEDATAMGYISQAVLDSKADLGVIFDADCDRAAIVDQNGKAINRNRLIALIAAILLDEEPGGTFVTDSVTSSGLAQFIAEWGGTHYRYKRGYRNVIDEAIRLNAEGINCPLAIETSGHAALRENYFLDDGMYLVTRLICEAMRRKREGKTLSSLIDDLQEPVESTEIRLPILEEDFRTAGQDVIERILSHTLDNPEWNLAPDNREGVRITFNLEGGVNNAWFLLRLSVHDPVMPLNAESDVPGGVKYMLGQLLSLIGDEKALDIEPLRRAVEG